VASTAEGTWYPAPGYTWVNTDPSGVPTDFVVRWEPGRGYWYLGALKWPHVVAARKEGSWFPEAGYVWANPDASGKPEAGDWSVRWLPGKAHQHLGEKKWPNVVASTTEGRWWPAPGYVWVRTDGNGVPSPDDWSVRWQPGAPYRYLGEVKWPYVSADATEGQWKPDAGYVWARPGVDHSVKAIAAAPKVDHPVVRAETIPPASSGGSVQDPPAGTAPPTAPTLPSFLREKER
jgi:hypothetical protein